MGSFQRVTVGTSPHEFVGVREVLVYGVVCGGVNRKHVFVGVRRGVQEGFGSHLKWKCTRASESIGRTFREPST